MAFTVLNAIAHIEHALGGPLVGIDNQRILDEAGRKLLSLRDWNFQKRPSTTIGFVAGQSYVSVPSDFGEIVTLEFTSGSSQRVVQTSLTTIALYRSVLGAIPGYMLYVAPTFAADSNGIPRPRLEVHPVPQTTDSTALTMFYRARWVDLADTDSTYIPLPDWMESVYIQIVRATALGYQNEDMSKRMTEVLAGPDWMAAVRTDMTMQWKFGPLTNGALESANVDDGVWYLRNAALPPAAG